MLDTLDYINVIVSTVFLGLANPRRMKLRRGTFLRFGHRPVLRNLAKLLATISMICSTESA